MASLIKAICPAHSVVTAMVAWLAGPLYQRLHEHGRRPCRPDCRLLAINIDLERWIVVQPVSAHSRKIGVVVRHREELVAGRHQLAARCPRAPCARFREPRKTAAL